MAGLGIKDRVTAGLKGGVKWMAYMTALVPVKGETLMDTRQLAGPIGNGTLEGSWIVSQFRSYIAWPRTD
jgi:hypothetical protein